MPTQDVVRKIYIVRHILRRLDRKQGTQTRMADYKWLAQELGLAWAVNTLRRTIRDSKNLRIDSGSEDDSEQGPKVVEEEEGRVVGE